MTIANIITLCRIGLIPFFMWMMGIDSPEAKVVALVLFVLASVTDGVDGYIARKMNQVTNFGKFVDPLADKLLVTGAILLFVQDGIMPVWVAMLIIAREFIVTSLRMVAAAEGVVIAAGFSGKVKTLVQIVCIVFLLTPYYSFSISGVPASMPAVLIMGLVTLWSGIDYCVRHKDVINFKN